MSQSITKFVEDLPHELREIFERNKGFVPDIDRKNAEEPAKAEPTVARQAPIQDEKMNKRHHELKNQMTGSTSIIGNVMARTSIFSPVRKKKTRDHVSRKKISQGYEIEILGEELDELDRDVFLYAMQLYFDDDEQGNPNFNKDFIKVTCHKYLKGIGRPYGATNIKSLRDSVHRLAKTVIDIKPAPGSKHRVSYAGNIFSVSTMVDEDDNDPKKNYIIFTVPTKFVMGVFDGYTRIPIDERLKLKGKGFQLARWLHAFASSHEKVKDMKLETYYSLVYRAETLPTKQQLRDFKKELITSLELMKAKEIITKWSIENNMVSFVLNKESPSEDM